MKISECNTYIAFLQELHSQLEMGCAVNKREIESALVAIKGLIDAIDLRLCVDLMIEFLDVCIKLQAVPMLKYTLAGIEKDKIDITKLQSSQIDIILRARKYTTE